jgi:hypothetical protein
MLAVVMGTVHPVSGGWLFEEPVRIPFHDGKWMLIFKHSQFHVFINGQEPDDLGTFMNEVESIAQGCLDALGFHLATPVRAEITSMVIDGNRLVHRTLRWPDLLPDSSTLHVTEDELRPFVEATIEESLARLALADLRRAIESPDDTAFLAYRAVESVRQWFLVGTADNKSAREQSWKDMRATLALEESSLRWLEKLALSRRHGAVAPPTASERKEAMLLARDVVARFITHIDRRTDSAT